MTATLTYNTAPARAITAIGETRRQMDLCVRAGRTPVRWLLSKRAVEQLAHECGTVVQHGAGWAGLLAGIPMEIIEDHWNGSFVPGRWLLALESR